MKWMGNRMDFEADGVVEEELKGGSLGEVGGLQIERVDGGQCPGGRR